jgi:hypothetical protein
METDTQRNHWYLRVHVARFYNFTAPAMKKKGA